jgi:hypothetical protein
MRGLLVVLLGLLAATPSRATFQLFTVDPTRSFVAIAAGSGLSIDLGSLAAVSLPFSSQLGVVADVTGATLPDGTTSDGFRTSVSGQVLADVTPTTIRFYSQQTLLVAGVSGSWQTGPPATRATPANAQLAVHIADDLFARTGNAALRDAAFTYSSPAIALTPDGSFDAAQSLRAAAGEIDFRILLSGLSGRDFLSNATTPNGAGTGSLKQKGKSERLVIPLDLPLDFALVGSPFDIDARLTGQIVATIPEPDPMTAGLVALGCTVLAAARRSES